MSDPQPWTRAFLIGNFAVNTADVVTNEDGASTAIVSDYVLASALPSANLEQFSVAVYLPSSPSAEPTVSDARVTAGRTDGTRTSDIHRSHERVGDQTIGGHTYTACRVSGSVTGSPPLTKETFANVVFELDVSYGEEHASTKKVEVYKR